MTPTSPDTARPRIRPALDADGVPSALRAPGGGAPAGHRGMRASTHAHAGGGWPTAGLGRLLIGVGLVAAGAAIAGRVARPPRPAGESGPAVLARGVRRTRDGAAILGASVLADSAMEHFRGGFHRRPMYAAPVMGALSMGAALAEPRPGVTGRPARAVQAAALAVGAAGLVFHARNVLRRPGGLDWNNLFYAAPVGAPGALAVSGLLAMASERLAARDLPLRDDGRTLAALTGAALLGETAEVWLLHFRGAFHDPAMFLPVTVPPAAAGLLLAEAARPRADRRRTARRLLGAVNALGVIGTALHVLGVARNMGGWGNWRQTALAGPPVPAPISFTGLGLAGLAALDLLDQQEDTR